MIKSTSSYGTIKIYNFQKSLVFSVAKHQRMATNLTIITLPLLDILIN